MPRVNSEKIRSEIYHALVQFHSDIELESILKDNNGSEFIENKFQQMLADYNIKYYRRLEFRIKNTAQHSHNQK